MIVQLPQHVLQPAGPQAARIESLWWFMFIVSTIVFLSVIIALLWATLHRRGATPDAEPARARHRTALAVGGATAATIVILLVFLVVEFSTHRALVAYGVEPQPLTIEITGHQWWWEIEYVDSAPQRRVTTANEIHIPVGRPVLLKTTSRDVIHSLWIPNLAGKRDLIPGHQGALIVQADRPGTYRAQCAEFCGHQHAKMALWVVAEPEAEFNAWMARQSTPPPPPTDSLAIRGREVFLGGPCVMCHAIQGTPAGSRVGPDLTHLASRLTIAAGTLPNTRGHLAGWILDPQRVKPGVRMPSTALTSEELHALLAYLETLR